MTNEKRKQEAIKKAYGDYWDNFSDCVDRNGMANLDRDFTYEDMGLELQSNGNWRPKSLDGIETNNGWIRIDENLNHNQEPEKGQYWTIFRNGFIEVSYYDGTRECYKFWRLNFTHYQPIVKPNLPIY